MKIRQLFVAKFKSSRLKLFDYNIKANYNQLFCNGEIVQLADNQALRSIRALKKSNIDFNEIDELYNERNKLKFLENNKINRNKIKKIQDKINKMLYTPEYIIIKIEHKKHYEYLFENGLIFNGMKYKRFSCSAGQARVSTVAFVSDNILDKLNEILDNGRDKNKPLTPSKFNAYKGLSTSSTFEVSEPKYCVVKDYLSKLDVDVDFVTETGFDEDDIIEQKKVNMEFNRFDGMGLISPKQSKKWADELGLNYVPAQWCIRQNYIKGMLCTFDIHKFCKEKNNSNYIIETLYGDKVNLENIDIILTEGQFKLWDSFESFEAYNKNCRKNNLRWGVSLYSPQYDKEMLKMNYQFLQTLNLNKTDIENVCQKFIKWVDGVNGEDIHYALLFLIGLNVTEENIRKYFSLSGNYWIKSLVVCNELIKDNYIRDKIYDLVKKKINDACLGNIIVDGNFQVIVSDPYAMMEHVCGLEVNGLLSKNEYYSNYWNKKGINIINSMRAPLTGRSEHLVLNLKNNDELNKWYEYCYTGIILNVHGSETLNYAGSDFDYDIIATTSDSTIINATYKNELPVVYEPPKPKKVILNDYELYYSDLFGFGSKIGQITNKSTSAYALLNNFKKGTKEHDELINRLKMCIKLQSQQIDKTKIGKEVKGIPKLWTTYNKETDDDTDETKCKKNFYNSILLDKHPYFFRYLYKDTDKKYKNYIKQMDNKFKSQLNTSLNDLLDKQEKTSIESEYIEGYKKFLPVIDSNSVMNNICKHIESFDFGIRNKKKAAQLKDVYKLLMTNAEINKSIYKKVLNLYKKLNKERELEYDLNLLVGNANDYDYGYDQDLGDIINNKFESFKNKLLNLDCSVCDIIDCLIHIMYVDFPKSNKVVLWETFGEEILKNLIDKFGAKINIPMPKSNGAIEYLNKRFELREVNL